MPSSYIHGFSGLCSLSHDPPFCPLPSSEFGHKAFWNMSSSRVSISPSSFHTLTSPPQLTAFSWSPTLSPTHTHGHITLPGASRHSLAGRSPRTPPFGPHGTKPTMYAKKSPWTAQARGQAPSPDLLTFCLHASAIVTLQAGIIHLYDSSLP